MWYTPSWACFDWQSIHVYTNPHQLVSCFVVPCALVTHVG